MTDRGDSAPWPFVIDPEETSRLVREVQDLGFGTARIVVEQFAELFSRFSETVSANDDGNAPPGREAEPAVQFRMGPGPADNRLRSEMNRALDAYVAVLRQLGEVSLAPFGTGRTQAATPGTERLVLPEVAPGGRCSSRIWLHNATSSAVTAVRPWTGALASHFGATLSDETVTFDPQVVSRLDPGESHELLVTACIAEDAALGSYHGQILVEHLPDVVLPLTIVVVPGVPSP